MGAPLVLSLVLFRVLVKEGVILKNQDFRRNWLILSFIWPVIFLPGLFAVLFGNNAAMSDRLRAGSITCVGTLIIVLSWFLFILVLRSKRWATRPDFIKAFPRHCFYFLHLVSISWPVLLIWGVWMSWVALAPSSSANVEPLLIPPTDLSMTLSVELVSTGLLAMLAMSAPAVLSVVLFGVLVKEGVPIESQKFRRRCLLLSLTWLMLFLPLFAAFFRGNASMSGSLRITFAVIVVLVLIWFFFILVLRRKYWLKLPYFIEKFPSHFFFLVYISWWATCLVQY